MAVLRRGQTGTLAWLGLVLTCTEVVSVWLLPNYVLLMCTSFPAACGLHQRGSPTPTSTLRQGGALLPVQPPSQAPPSAVLHPRAFHWAALGQVPGPVLPLPGLSASQVWGCIRTCAHGGCGLCVCVGACSCP